MNQDNYKITIDETSGIPIWMQLRNQLAFLIISGVFKPGDRIPTVRELATELNINYNTVLKVCQFLEQEGYIVSKRGKGSFVSDLDKANIKPANEADLLIDQFLDQCIELGLPLSAISLLVQNRVEERIHNE